MEKIKARDGIRGAQHPTPFIVKSEEVDQNLFENTHYNLLGQLIYLQKNQLPDTEKKLYANNKDTKEYILGYLNGQQGTPFEYGETVELKRKYPYYVQWDRRWAYDALGGTNVAIGGCGPTVVAMALSGMLKDETITPKQISEIENANGYFTSLGTKWSFFDFIANKYNLKSIKLSLSKVSIDEAVDRSNPIITSVRPGKFTTVGHIILIVGKDNNGNYIINDPNSYNRTLKTWSYDELQTEIIAMWEFSK
ncbi:C39 family peptidase [Gemella morbillorum]|uniref:C39 family peptidase n=1 Tax=Gemella morbillorum TaxID=29391 RepID=UPI001CCE169D|nr:C39 family peptidase [Gemella morbillorum]UBH80076.1 C39 family peptidase [Gemella morbillorum]